LNNLRLKISLILIIISTGLTTWAWLENTGQLDILITHDIHYFNRWEEDFKTTEDIERLRTKSLELIETLNYRHERKDEIGQRVQLLLSITILTTLTSMILIIVEILKKKKRHANNT
jgi:hypothetical protein